MTERAGSTTPEYQNQILTSMNWSFAFWWLAGCLGLTLFSACETDPVDEPQTPQELLVGKWNIASIELLGAVNPGNGSFLEFEGCANTCTGVDYNGNDSTQGAFIYNLNTEGTLLAITDTSSAGGSYNYDFDVLELTETALRFIGSTIFGTMKIEAVRED